MQLWKQENVDKARDAAIHAVVDAIMDHCDDEFRFKEVMDIVAKFRPVFDKALSDQGVKRNGS